MDKCDLVQLSAGVCVVQIQSISWSIPNKDSAVPACLIPPKKSTPQHASPYSPGTTKADSPPFPSSAAFLPVMWEAGDAFCGSSPEQQELRRERKASAKIELSPAKNLRHFLYTAVSRKNSQWSDRERKDLTSLLSSLFH